MNGSGLDVCLGLIRWENEEGVIFCSLLQSPFTQLPMLFSCPKVPSFFFFPHRTHKISMMPTVPTHAVLPTTHSLFRSQQCLAVSRLISKSLSFLAPWFPTSCFLCLECLLQCPHVLQGNLWFFFLNLCKCFLLGLSSFTPPQFPSILNPSINKYWDSRNSFFCYTNCLQLQSFVSKPVSRLLIPWKFIFLLLFLSL